MPSRIASHLLDDVDISPGGRAVEIGEAELYGVHLQRGGNFIYELFARKRHLRAVGIAKMRRA
jgi:hypothetical protein